MPARRRRGSRRGACLCLGRRPARLGSGADPCVPARRARKRDCSDAGDSTPTRSSSAIPDTSTCLRLDVPREAGRSSSTRSSHSWTRSSRIAVGSGRARSRHALSRQPTAGHFAPPTSSSQTRRRDAQFFAGLAGLDEVPVCFVGAEDRLFRPNWSPPDRFVALFVGKLIPLQGVETILQAARQAPEIDFRLVGSGQLEASTGVQAAERRARAVDRVRAPAGGDPARGLLARNLRRPAARRGASSRTRRSRPSHARRRSSPPTRLPPASLLVDEESALLVPAGDAGALARRSAPAGG